MNDRENAFVHIVTVGQLKDFRRGRIGTVTAECGKRWAPTKIGWSDSDHLGKPACPQCWSKFRYAISA